MNSSCTTLDKILFLNLSFNGRTLQLHVCQYLQAFSFKKKKAIRKRFFFPLFCTKCLFLFELLLDKTSSKPVWNRFSLVLTMKHRSSLMPRTTPKTSTLGWLASMESAIVSRPIRVPVRPTPAEQWTRTGERL